MNRWERTLQHTANVLVCTTGVLYAVMRYLLEPADEFAVVNHPWQPLLQHLHVLAAPLLVFACGLIWKRHVSENWRREPHRRSSGPGLALCFVPMVASGYLLQTTTAAGWRQAWVVLHVAASTVWVAASLVHARWAVRRLAARLTAAFRARHVESDSTAGGTEEDRRCASS